MSTVKYASLEESIFNAFKHYTRARAEVIITKAQDELRKAIEEELTKTVLNLNKIVDFEENRNRIIFTIHKRGGNDKS